MKYAFVAVFLLFASIANAQKCRFDVDKADPITGKSKKQIDCILSKSWKIHFVDNGGEQMVVLYLVLPGSQNMQISRGDSLFMRLENGSVVTLTARADALPAPFVGPGNPGYRQVLSSYIPEYSCTAEDLGKLAQSPMIALRVYFGSTPVTLEAFKDKHTQKIMSAANCIMK